MEHTKAISYFKIFRFAAFFSDDWSTVFLPYFQKKEKKKLFTAIKYVKTQTRFFLALWFRKKKIALNQVRFDF